MPSHFSGTKSVKTARCMTHSLRHVVPSVAHKLRTVHLMRDTKCHACVLNGFVVTSRDTLENIMNISKRSFATTWHALLHLTRIATHRHASPRTLSWLPPLARQIACCGVNRLSCQCAACFTQALSFGGVFTTKLLFAISCKPVYYMTDKRRQKHRPTSYVSVVVYQICHLINQGRVQRKRCLA